MDAYSYPSGKPQSNLYLKETTPRWLRYVVDFPTAHPTRYEKNNTVRGEYFQPRGTNNAPLTILVHGMGDLSVIPCKLLAKALVKRGIACFVLYLVFHSSRMPEVVKKRLLTLTPEEWFEGYQISVTDVRQVVDWASSRLEINKEQIAVSGISFGGFISAIAMGIDKRIKAGVFLVTGGNYENPAWAKKWHPGGKEAERLEAQNRYAHYLAKVAKWGYENVTPFKTSYLTDPMTFATYLHKRPVIMLNARWDKHIPKQAALDFWGACGKPEITLLPATHSSIWL